MVRLTLSPPFFYNQSTRTRVKSLGMGNGSKLARWSSWKQERESKHLDRDENSQCGLALAATRRLATTLCNAACYAVTCEKPRLARAPDTSASAAKRNSPPPPSFLSSFAARLYQFSSSLLIYIEPLVFYSIFI